jgi:3-deoxy-D-manno-octulosonic-acid transferase
MYGFYTLLTLLASPFFPLLLRWRCGRGKEIPTRLKERYGVASAPRSEGKWLWIHAASMGEAASILPVITLWQEMRTEWRILVTSVTVTSAKMLAGRLPEGVIHQFLPLDHPRYLQRFLSYWQPEMALLVESELWPHLIHITHQRQIPLFLVNARMSARSFRRWHYAKKPIGALLECFTRIFAQSEQDAERLTRLGATNVTMTGNLKYDTPPLPVEVEALEALQKQIAGRPVWLAASTHAGEEAIIAATHQALKKDYPTLLTLLVPRHAERGGEIASLLRTQGLSVSTRSQQQPFTETTEIYLADTMGELGLWYRLASVAFLGGSLIPHGGQNLLEPLRLGCAVITGPHTHNFQAMVQELKAAHALTEITDATSLSAAIKTLWENETLRQQLLANSQRVLTQHRGALMRVVEALE